MSKIEFIQAIMLLFIVFQFKHFIADFLLQGKYMIGKFKPGWGFVPPLALHCGVHALFTFAIVWVITCFYVKDVMFSLMWQLPLIDFIVHFIMDRIKASPKLLGKYKYLSANEYLKVAKKAAGYYTNNGDTYMYTQPEITEARKLMRHNTLFWWFLGVDQMVHCLTHYYIIYMLLTAIIS